MTKLAMFLVGMSMALGANAAVFTWTDENGEVHYSDVPEVDGAVLVEIESSATDRQAVAAQRDTAIANEIERQKRVQQESEVATQQSNQQQQDRAIAQRNCQKAREAYDNYYAAPRLYKPTDDGGREYLSGPEMDELRAKAQADVNEWCG